MKRILSVILSLALLATLLIIPMSVSATGENAPQTVTFSYDNRGTYFKKDDTTRISDGLSPVIYTTYMYSGAQVRKNICNLKNYSETIPALSNGDVDNRKDISLPISFDSSPNGYKSYSSTDATTVYDFDSSKINTYVDIIYDLGAVANINKIQQFSANYATTVGLYQIYTSTDVNTLFDESSLLLNYQNKTSDSAPYDGCQEHTFDAIEARYVVFRILSPTTTLANGNTLRICELAIYGSYDEAPAYTVKPVPTFNAWTSTGGEKIAVEEGNILSGENLTITGKKGDKVFGESAFSGTRLHDGYYGGHGTDTMHDDISTVGFYDSTNSKLSNGYNISRTADGKITFTQSGEIDTYACLTYDLGDYYKVKNFQMYNTNSEGYNETSKMQAYEVYVGNDKDSLYNAENKVAEYNNYFSMYGQVITFNDRFVGKYLGVKVLMPSLYNNGSNYIRLSEIAAYGECVGAPPVIQVEDGETCGSAVVTVTDVDDNLASVTVNGEEKIDSLDEGKLNITNTGDYTVVATDTKGNVTRKEFTVADHNFVYVADGAVITETCSSCDRAPETLTLKLKDGSLVYNGEDKSKLVEVEKTKGFAGWEGGIDFEINGKQAESVINAGNYVAKVTIDGVAFAELPFTIEKAIPDYTAPDAQTGNAGEELNTVKLGDGFAWKNPTEKIKYSNGNKFEYDAIYTPADVDNYKIAELKIEVNGIDITPPTGTIKIKETVWDKITNVVFGWFINEKETVTITGSDAGSGVDKILYYVTDAEVDDSALAKVEWTEYKETFKIEKEGNNVVYAKIFDKKGNSETINTDGIVLDTIAPTADVTNKGTYYGSLTVTVKDDNLDTVKLNGKDVTLDEEGKFTVSAADGEQTIVLTDKAGNTATYTVTVIEVKGLDAEAAAQGEQIVLTVDTDDKNIGETDKLKIAEKIEKSETVYYFDIGLDKISGGAINETNNVLEIPVDFNFAGKLNVRVLHNHGGEVKVLKALTARPTAGFETGTYFADTENGKLYIYSKEFSAFAVAFHVHDIKHVEAKAATAEADGNIEYWYCEGCDKYFSDAAATKEIAKADTVVKYVAPSNGNNGSNNAATGGENATNPTVPGGTSPVTGQTAMTVVLFTILLGALAVMGMAIVKSRKAKNK